MSIMDAKEHSSLVVENKCYSDLCVIFLCLICKPFNWNMEHWNEKVVATDAEEH